MSAKNGLFDPEYVAKERENILLVFDANESFLFLAKRKRRRRRPTKMSFFYFACALKARKSFEADLVFQSNFLPPLLFAFFFPPLF